MNILVIGSGAREHALAWKISQSPDVKEIYAFPGNAGLKHIATIPSLDNDNPETLLQFAKDHQIHLTVVGPEAYLANGITDLFEEHGFKVFGVNKKAAELESSKAFAKDIMKEAAIPTARYFVVDNTEEGNKILSSMKYPLVLKADGLAGGKGVSIVDSPEKAKKELAEMLEGKFKEAGSSVVIEEFLKGEELSLLLLVDGQNVKPLQFSQDHKAAFDGDTGPNTGGMGAYTPVKFADEKLYNDVDKKVTQPLLDALKNRGITFKGVLYIGLMIVDGKPYVLEYNVRFGDPETEPLMFALKSDILPYMLASVDGTLDTLPPLDFHDGYSVAVVLASQGYPGSYEKGFEISGLENVSKDAFVFHAGTREKDGKIVTSGGRVIMVTTRGKSIDDAISHVYENVNTISFKNAFYRKDIGHRELNRK